MDECLERLIDIIESRKDLKNLIPSERVAKLVRIRLEMQTPYISKWPQALSIQVLISLKFTLFYAYFSCEAVCAEQKCLI